MGFPILYPKDESQGSNLASIAVYLNAFSNGLGLGKGALQINTEALMQVINCLSPNEFPHVDGLDKASPFKKAANFFVWFVCCKPIVNSLPAEIIGQKLHSIENHQNVILAYHIAVDALHEATLQRCDGKSITLTNRIRVSEHFFVDFVEAFCVSVPSQNFKVASLLFEQLSYKVNPSASYPEVV